MFNFIQTILSTPVSYTHLDVYKRQNLDKDGTLEILISRANIKKITRVTVAEPGMTFRDSVLLHAEEAKKILKIRSHNS